MSGHSKWSTIKRKKGAADVVRGKIFTKLVKEITVAARIGGGDINGNPRLRHAVEEAKTNSMPMENVTRAIKKGTGELEGVSYEDIMYEGYGPGGVALIVEVLTDNKNRTVAEIRKIFERHGGSIGAAGCVAWMFERKGIVVIAREAAPVDRVIDVSVELGAEDVEEDKSFITIKTDQKNFEKLKKGLESQKIKPDLAKITMEPQSSVKLTGTDAGKVLKLISALEDNDDVQNVYANFDIEESEMERLALQQGAS